MKERDTVIISVRVKKNLNERIKQRVPMSKHKSKNAWLIWSIEQGLRRHKGNRLIKPSEAPE